MNGPQEVHPVRIVSPTKLELREDAGCAVALALISKQVGLEPGTAFTIDTRPQEQDVRAWDEVLMAVRFRRDWTREVVITPTDFGKTDPGANHVTGLPADLHAVALLAGSAFCARLMKLHLGSIMRVESVDRTSRVADLVEVISAGDPATRTRVQTWVEREARRLARHEPYIRTVTWFAGKLADTLVTDGYKAFREIIGFYNQVGGRFPLLNWFDLTAENRMNSKSVLCSLRPFRLSR